jgi:hypothetical protein
LDYELCLYEITPTIEDCATLEDEDCDGNGACSPGEHLWARQFSHSHALPQEDGIYIAVNGMDEIIVAGSFEGYAAFGGESLISAGSSDIFIAKFDSRGVPMWSKRLGDESYQGVNGVAFDKAGNILLHGTFSGFLVFDLVLLYSQSDRDGFLLKLDSNGDYIWGQGFSAATPMGVVADGDGNMLLTGSAMGADFGGGPLVQGGDLDAFLAKFDPSGNHIWSKAFGDASKQEGRRVAVDTNNNVLVTGNFQGNVDFGGGQLGPPSTGEDNAFLVKFDSSAAFLWNQEFGAQSYDIPSGIAIDSSDNVFVASTDGVYNLTVVKYDSQGAQAWSQSSGSGTLQSLRDIAVDSQGHISITGYFGCPYGTLYFGEGELSTKADCDIFVVKFDTSGDVLWSRSLGGSARQYADGFAIDSAGNIVLAGTFEQVLDLGDRPLQSEGQYSSFIAELAP